MSKYNLDWYKFDESKGENCLTDKLENTKCSDIIRFYIKCKLDIYGNLSECGILKDNMSDCLAIINKSLINK